MTDPHNKGPSSDRPYLNTAQAAHYIGLTPRHLERMRSQRSGPPYRRHGRFVFYHIDDLDAWSRSTGSGEVRND